MIQLTKITPQSLKDPNVELEVVKTAENNIARLDYGQCYRMYLSLRKAIEQGTVLVSPRLDSVFQKLQACIVPYLDNNQLKESFAGNLAPFLSVPQLSLRDRLREKMLTLRLEEEAVYKKELLVVLMKNERPLFEKSDATIGNMTAQIQKNTTLSDFKHIVQWDELPFWEQESAENFYDLVHYLLLDPTSLEGTDEVELIRDPTTGKLMEFFMGKMIDPETGEEVDISTLVGKEGLREQEFTINFADIIERKQLLHEKLRNMKSMVDPQHLVDEFQQALEQRDELRALGVMYQCALIGHLEELVRAQKCGMGVAGFQEFIQKTLIEQLRVPLSDILLIITDISNFALKTGHYNFAYPFVLDNLTIIPTQEDVHERLNAVYIMTRYNAQTEQEIRAIINFTPSEMSRAAIRKAITLLNEQSPEQIVIARGEIQKTVFENTQTLEYDLGSAFQIYKGLRAFIDGNQPMLHQNNIALREFEELETVLEWVLMPLIPDETVEDLIEHRFLSSYQVTVDVINQLELKLLLMPVEERNGFKDRLRRAILRNTERLTDQEVVVGTVEKRGAIVNWLLDFTEKVGNDPVTTIDFTHYITNSQNAAHLSHEERERLVFLLNFYERLKLTSEYVGGIVESIPFFDQGRLKVLLDGGIENIDNNKELDRILRGSSQLPQQLATQDPPQKISPEGSAKPQTLQVQQKKMSEGDKEIIGRFNMLPLSMSSIREKIADLSDRKKQNDKLISNVIVHVDHVMDKSFIVAALFVLAQDRAMPFDKDQQTAVSFVREILEQKMGWSAEDSAKIGIRLGHILGGEFKEMAYYNKQSKVFEWSI